MLVAALCYGISSPIVGTVADRVRKEWIVILGFLGLGGSYMLLGPSPYVYLPLELWNAYVSLALLGITASMAYIPTIPLLVEYTKDLGDSATDIVSGLGTSMFSLGSIVGPSLGSFLAYQIGFPKGSTIFAFLLVGIGLANIPILLPRHSYERKGKEQPLLKS
jgi:MFS family permease